MLLSVFKLISLRVFPDGVLDKKLISSLQYKQLMMCVFTGLMK